MIVIGDVHGEYDALMRLVEQLPEDDLCFVGDLVDRGPKSYDVLKFVIENGHDCTKGNHEYMFYNSPYSKGTDDCWSAHGKKVCLASFEGNTDKIQEYRDWCRDLPLYIEYKDCRAKDGRYLVVSHTGINYLWEHKDPNAGDNDYFGYSMLWENDWAKMRDRQDIDYEFYNIFGHSPQKDEPFVGKAYACVDGGGFIKDKPGFSRLTAIQYPSMEVWEEDV